MSWSWQMLMFASRANAASRQEPALSLAQYAEGWGRTGDIGLSVALKHDPQAAGRSSRWLRLWSGDNKAGFVDNAIPELAMVVLPAEHRGQRWC